jgi:hypothetical protein
MNCLRIDLVIGAQEQKPFHHISQLTNVSRPAICLQNLDRFSVHWDRFPSVLFAHLANEM